MSENDFRNASGYVSPTEVEALNRMEPPKQRKIHRVRVMSEKEIKAMDKHRPSSFYEFVMGLEDGHNGEAPVVMRDPDKTVRQLFSCLDATASLAGFRIDAIVVHSKDTGISYAK